MGPYQASFIHGRQPKDNIIIAQEIVHSLENKKGKLGGIILKIDLEKAYDRIDWNFLTKVLANFNLNEGWIKFIMNCVSQVETSIMWNWETLNSFKPTRGLGDIRLFKR